MPSDTPGSPAIARGSIENPTLAQATQAALGILARDDQGFFVMIEQGEIDHGNSYLRLAQPLAPGDLPVQQDMAGQWIYPDGEVSYQTGGHTNELVTLQAVGAGAGLFSSKAGTWYPGTQIVGNQLRTSAVFDYQAKPSYSVRVRSTDSAGQAYEKPLAITVTRAAYNLDADGNGAADALSDGILILRYLFDPGGSWNVADALGSGATRTTRPDIANFLQGGRATFLDADGNGATDALSDGILILRYLFDPTGQWNVDDALGTGATRTTRTEIAAYLAGFTPSSPPAPRTPSPQLAARDIALAFWSSAGRSADDSDEDPLWAWISRP